MALPLYRLRPRMTHKLYEAGNALEEVVRSLVAERERSTDEQFKRTMDTFVMDLEEAMGRIDDVASALE